MFSRQLFIATLTIACLPASAQHALADEIAEATAIFEAAFASECDWALGGPPAMREPEVHEMSYRPSWDEPSDPARGYRLYRFLCSQGAYNQSHVFIAATDDDGLGVVQFAMPDIAVTYAAGADGRPDDATISQLSLNGFAAQARLGNSTVDAGAGTIAAISYWRGLGDAASTGEWQLLDGSFVLRDYTVDASYDGEVNPMDIVSAGQVVLK